MKLSNVLLTAMLSATYTGLAQESITKLDLESLNISNNQKSSVEITIDSVLLKKIDSLYAKRIKLRLNQKSINKMGLNQQNTSPEKVIKSHFNCPGCGRG